MRISKKTLTVILSLIAVSCVFAFGLFLSFGKAKADFSGGELQNEYFVGETVSVPDGSFSVDGKTLSAKFEVEYPDGQVYTLKNFKVSQYGIYTVKYFAEDGGKIYEQKVDFSVNMPLFEVKGTGSAEYGDYSIYNPYESSERGIEFTETFKAVKVALTSGSTFVYNRTVDLTEFGKSESLIDFQITPDEIGYTDFRRINIKVTDVHDPDTYVILRMKDKENDDGEYISYSYVSINNDYKYYRGRESISSVYGVGCHSSFRGKPGLKGNTVAVVGYNTLFENDYLSFIIDEEENVVYKMDSTNRRVNTITSVCDLVGTGVGFKGFTTGEVKIEIYGDMYSNTYAKFLIRNIAGANLAEEIVEDDVAPKITVDYGDYTADTIPEGKVSNPYPVFSAKGYDRVDGDVEVTPYVYKYYHSNNRVSVSVEDGCFVPDTVGEYTICYVAKDRYKNYAEECVEVKVVDTDNPVSFELSNRGIEETTVQGEKIKLATVENVAGGFGKINFVLSVKNSAGKEIAVFNDATVENTVQLMNADIYTVSYTATDYVKQSVTKTYNLTVGKNSGSVIADDLDKELEKRYIVGYGYKLPNIKAYMFTGNDYELKDATVSVDNGKVENGVYTPANEGTVKFTYTCGTGSEEIIRPVYSLKSAGKLDVKKTFITGENVTAGFEEKATGLKYLRYLISADTSIEYINPLLAESFAFKFNTELNYAFIGKINMYLTDCKNPDEQVKFSFEKVNDKFSFNVNDGLKTELVTKITGLSNSDFSLSVSASSATATADGVNFNIEKYLNGNSFKGFSSNKVFLKIDFEGVKGSGFAFIVKNVSGFVPASNVTADKTKPIIMALTECGGTKDINSTYKLPEVVASDVIAPALSSFTVSVLKPDGTPLFEDQPVARREFVLDSYGTYSITYKALDQSNNYNDFVFAIHVLDVEKPTINKTPDNDKAKVGDTVKVEKIKISDNYAKDGETVTYIFVKRPDGFIIQIGNDNPTTKLSLSKPADCTFVAEQKGVYTVYYYVYDNSSDGISQGNVTVLSYTVKVA